jgi:hypothetical protein|tara:strand:+ start:96 stop:302 length:207 start_codon:yes stop_codon:yes gene_type:complete
MALSKQSIRSTQKIYLNRSQTPSEKLEIITLSEGWTGTEVETFKKLLKQGGSMNIQGNHFKIVRENNF